MWETIAFLILILSGGRLAGAQDGTEVKEQSVETVDFCDLFRYPSRYDGRMVKVTATYVSDFESARFFDESCKKSESLPEVVANVKFTDKTGDYDKLSKILRKEKLVPRTARVSIMAVFDDEWSGDGAVPLAGRSRYTLKVMQVLAAERIFPLTKGELVGIVNSDRSLGPLRISIRETTSSTAIETMELNEGKKFEFDAVAPGEYVLDVTNANYCVEYRTTVAIKPGKTTRVSIGRAQKLRPNLCQ